MLKVTFKKLFISEKIVLVVREVPGKHLLSRRDQIEWIIEVGVRLKCKDAISVMSRSIQNCLSSLVAFYPQSSAIDKRKDTNLEEYLPIRVSF